MKKVVAFVLGLSAVVPAAALAGHDCREHYPAGTRCADSEVSIRNPEEGRFAGRVTSHMRWCEKNRKVVLKKVRKGDDRRVASTRTNDNGRWRLDDVGVEGRVYAVARYKERSYGIDSRDICYRAKSRTIRVDG